MMAEYKSQTSQENHIVEKWLLYRDERVKDLEQMRESILGASPSTSVVDMSSFVPGEISDKTGDKGSALAMLKQEEEWLKLIDDFEASLPRDKKIFLDLRREYRFYRGRQGWTSRVQWKFSERLASQIGGSAEDLKHRSTYYSWWKDLLNEVAREALRRGLL